EYMPAAQVHAASCHVNVGICSWRGSVAIKAGGIIAFPGVVVDVKLHGHALQNAVCRGIPKFVRAVAKPSAAWTERGGVVSLDDEREPIGHGVGAWRDLETKVGRERRNVHRRAVPGGCRFRGTSIRQTESCAIQSRFSIENHSARGEAAAKVNRSGRC